MVGVRAEAGPASSMGMDVDETRGKDVSDHVWLSTWPSASPPFDAIFDNLDPG